MCSATLWARNVSSRWLGCARGTTLSTAFALPANWTRMAPPLRPPGRRLRRVTSAPTTLATSARTSPGAFGSVGLALLLTATAAANGGDTPSPLLGVFAVGLLFMVIAHLVFTSVVLFNRPRFLVPPVYRTEPG